MPDANRHQARPLLSQREFAEQLGVTTRTVRTWIARGIVRAHRVPGTRTIRIHESEVERVLRPIPASGGDRVAS